MTKQVKVDIDLECPKEAEQSEQPDKSSSSSAKTWVGLLIVLLLAITSTVEIQFANSMASLNFTAFTFATWYGRNFSILIYPCYCLFGLMTGKSLKSMWSEDCVVLKQDGNYKQGFFKKVLPVTVIYNSAYYFYYYALDISPPSDCSAVMAVNIALIYILSIYWLKEPLLALRVIAVVAAMTGVFVFAYSYGLHGSSILGIIFSLSVAVLTAIYRVYLKLVLPDPSVGQASLLLTVVCALIVLFSWPLILVATSLGIETIEWETIPWYELNVTSIFSLLVSALIFLGTAVSFPIFVAVGMLLSIPGNAFVDVIYRHIIFDGIKIFGVFLICSSFLILLIPVDKARRLSRWMVPCCYRKVTL